MSIEALSIIVIGVAVLLVAIALLRVSILLRHALRWYVRSYTHQVIHEDAKKKSAISRLVHLLESKEYSLDELENREELYLHVQEILDYCETISSGVLQGIYDEDTVRSSYGHSFVVLYVYVERLINEMRFRTNNPDVYSAYSKVVDMWKHARSSYERHSL